MQIKLRELGIATVILAAGKSTRMGEGHKLRLPLPDGRIVLQHTVGQALAWEPLQCLVVLQPDEDDLTQVLRTLPLEIVINPDFESGMASSLSSGIRSLNEEVAAALVLLGDEPHIPQDVIRILEESYQREGRNITIPVYGDVPGPPTLFRREVFPELLALSGDEGGRAVVRRDPTRVSRVALPAELMPADLDTPEDYRRFYEQAGKAS